MEIDVAAAAEEIRSIGKDSDGSQVCLLSVYHTIALLLMPEDRQLTFMT